MIECPACDADTRKLEATVYVCKNEASYVVHDFGLEQLLKTIGINNRTIKSIYRQIKTNNDVHTVAEGLP